MRLKLGVRTRALKDHNLSQLYLTAHQYLLTAVYIKNITLRSEILQLFTHFNYLSLVTWYYPRYLSPSLCRSEQHHFTYKFIFFNTLLSSALM